MSHQKDLLTQEEIDKLEATEAAKHPWQIIGVAYYARLLLASTIEDIEASARVAEQVGLARPSLAIALRATADRLRLMKDEREQVLFDEEMIAQYRSMVAEYVRLRADRRRKILGDEVADRLKDYLEADEVRPLLNE